MFKVYQKYIIFKFLKKFILICIIFLGLTLILGVLEEISFFKKIDTNVILPYILTFLNGPITLFEIFPFIFLLSTQFFFHEIFKKDELLLFKNSGLSNLKIIIILFFTSISLGIILNTIFYNFAAKLKFLYTDIKNSYSIDNNYLAAVTDSGIWLKDEIDNKIIIVKAKTIDDNNLNNVVINQFDMNFNLLETIQAEKINILSKNWTIYSPLITKENITTKSEYDLNFNSSFDLDKISNLFSNISTLNIIQLIDLTKDYENLGYSSDEIKLHLMRLMSNPFFYSLMTIMSAIIMLNIKKNKSLIFYLLLGILLSVIIYYFNYTISSLGYTGKIPIEVSIFMPIGIIAILVTAGLITINEK